MVEYRKKLSSLGTKINFERERELREAFDFFNENIKESKTNLLELKNTNASSDLKEFFTDKISQDQIVILQLKFNGLKGKSMAILISLLSEKGLLKIDNNSRKEKSRIYFVRNFTNKPLKSIQSVNKHFQAITGDLLIDRKDSLFMNISDELNKIVSSC